jgi:hypothetical protein
MTAITLSELPRHTDRLRLRDGKTLTVRFVGADEGKRCNTTSVSFQCGRATAAFWVP